MQINVPCPHCQNELHLPNESLLGQWARCPQCQAKFQLLLPEEPITDAVEPQFPVVRDVLKKEPLESEPLESESVEDDSEESVQTLDDLPENFYTSGEFNFDDSSEDIPAHDQTFTSEQIRQSQVPEVPVESDRDEKSELPPAIFEELFGRRSFDAKKFVDVPADSESKPTNLPAVTPSNTISQRPTGTRVWMVMIIGGAFLLGGSVALILWWAFR